MLHGATLRLVCSAFSLGHILDGNHKERAVAFGDSTLFPLSVTRTDVRAYYLLCLRHLVFVALTEFRFANRLLLLSYIQTS